MTLVQISGAHIVGNGGIPHGQSCQVDALPARAIPRGPAGSGISRIGRADGAPVAMPIELDAAPPVYDADEEETMRQVRKRVG